VSLKQRLGIDLGGTNIRLGLVDEGNIEKLISKKISSKESEGVVLEEIISSIDEIFNASVEGIGIGVPSMVNINEGIVYEVHNIPSWREVHLKSILEAKFHVPVQINNDVNCFVLGEKNFGKGKNYQNIVGLALGTGLGGGIITDGKLYSGHNGGAGEFGLMKYKDYNYEYYCSGQFFREVHSMKGEDVLKRANQNIPEAIAIFEQFGKHIGELINSIMYALNPELILLGGSVSSTYDYFKESMMKVIEKYEFKTQIQHVKIEKSELEHAAVLGASFLI
jgi:glucokinase